MTNLSRSNSPYLQVPTLAFALAATFAGCGSDGDPAPPAEVQQQLSESIPQLLNSTLDAFAFVGDSEQFEGLAQTADSMQFLLQPLFGDDTQKDDAISSLVADDELTSGQVTSILIDRIFTTDNYLGDGIYRIPTDLLCDVEPVAPCRTQMARVDPRIRAESAGDGMDFTLLIGPQNASPISLELRPARIAIVGDFAEGKKAVEHITGIDSAESIDLPDTMQGVLAASLTVNSTNNVTLALDIRQAIQIVGTVPDGNVAIHVAATDLFSLNINAPAQSVQAKLNAGRTQIGFPSEYGTVAIDLQGMSATLALEPDQQDIQLLNLGFGNDTSSVKIAGTTIFSVDLNVDSNRRFDLEVTATDTLPLFAFTPEFDLSLFVDLTPLVDEDSPLPEFVLGERYNIALTGNAPALQFFPDTIENDYRGGIEVVSGELAITSSAGTGDIVVTEGQCFVPSPMTEGEHQLLGHFASGVCQ